MGIVTVQRQNLRKNPKTGELGSGSVAVLQEMRRNLASDPRTFGRQVQPCFGCIQLDIRNLAAPHEMGLRTVHVAPEPDPAPHIHHHTDDLTGFLARLAD